MRTILAVPAACLALAGSAAQAGDGTGIRTVATAVAGLPVAGQGRAVPSDPPAAGLELRRTEPEATSALGNPAEIRKPWCPPGRRVGTGAGFCLVN